MNPKLKTALLIVLVLVATVAGISVAATVLTSPENISGTPLNPTPTPAPSTSPTPTPSQTVTPTELHLTSNYTEPFYKGDTLRLTAQLNQPAEGITVELYNNGEPLLSAGVPVTAQTDASGQAVFDRKPQNPFNYYVVATIP